LAKGYGPGRAGDAARADDRDIAGRRSPSFRPSSRTGQLARAIAWGARPPPAAGFGDRPRDRAIRVRFRPFKNQTGTMLGWLRLELPSGLVINAAKLMIGTHGRRWMALPAVPQVRPDGSPRVIDGKKAWHPIVEFQSKAVREKFEAQVLGALRASHPALFKGEAE